jgi:hypothetical protein
MKHRRDIGYVALALTALVAVAGCAGSSGPPGDPRLASYTDPGDGCHQVVTAITYADNLLKPLGQEAYQTFGADVRSRVATVDGTIALEMKDFPTKQIREQAVRTGKIATAGMKAGVSRRDRITRLRVYRREAAEMVLLCGPYVDPTPSARPSAR